MNRPLPPLPVDSSLTDDRKLAETKDPRLYAPRHTTSLGFKFNISEMLGFNTPLDNHRRPLAPRQLAVNQNARPAAPSEVSAVFPWNQIGTPIPMPLLQAGTHSFMRFTFQYLFDPVIQGTSTKSTPSLPSVTVPLPQHSDTILPPVTAVKPSVSALTVTGPTGPAPGVIPSRPHAASVSMSYAMSSPRNLDSIAKAGRQRPRQVELPASKSSLGPTLASHYWQYEKTTFTSQAGSPVLQTETSSCMSVCQVDKQLLTTQCPPKSPIQDAPVSLVPTLPSATAPPRQHSDSVPSRQADTKPPMSAVTSPSKPAHNIALSKPHIASVPPLGTNTVQCNGITRAGRQCLRHVRLLGTHSPSDSDPTPVLYCWQHTGQSVASVTPTRATFAPEKTTARCSGITQAGRQCLRQIRLPAPRLNPTPKLYCWQHTGQDITPVSDHPATSSSERDTVQCSAITRAGRQCRRQIKLHAIHSHADPMPVLYCWQHEKAMFSSQPDSPVLPSKWIEKEIRVPAPQVDKQSLSIQHPPAHGTPTKPAPSPPSDPCRAKSSSRNQCSGITLAGRRCRRQVKLFGTDSPLDSTHVYCWQHDR